jgi:lipopolysaccharide assembly outer membrane protein LptD (OstA)
MKRLVLILCVAALAFAQTPLKHSEMLVHAIHQETNGVVLHLTGNVSIESDSMVLRADEADYDPDTQEIVPRGNVRIKLK